jgi:hypothetical protein
MIAAEKYMTCEDRCEAERNKLKGVLLHRGRFFEDEEAAYKTLLDVLQWFKDDREESDRIELAAMEAEDERERNDPNYKTRQMFKGVKIKLPTRGMEQ